MQAHSLEHQICTAPATLGVQDALVHAPLSGLRLLAVLLLPVRACVCSPEVVDACLIIQLQGAGHAVCPPLEALSLMSRPPAAAEREEGANTHTYRPGHTLDSMLVPRAA